MSLGPYGMQTISGDKLDEVHRTFTGYLFDGLGQNERWTVGTSISNELPTRGNEAKAKFATRYAGVHEWVDERQLSQLANFDYTLTMKRWSNGIELDMDNFEDETANLGQFRQTISDFGDDHAEQKHALQIALLAAGEGTTLGSAYDGISFFNAARPYGSAGSGMGSGTFSNYLSGGGSAFSSTSFYTALTTMEAVRKPNGLLANIHPTHLIAPVALRSAVEAVINVRTISTAGENVHYKRVEPIFDPRLDAYSTTAWYLLDASKFAKPLFYGIRQEVGSDMVVDPWNRKVKWGAWGRYNFAYAFPQVMLKSAGA